jgi:hypothetical protein
MTTEISTPLLIDGRELAGPAYQNPKTVYA